MSSEPINVVVAMDFSSEIMEQLRGISPRLHIERYFPDVPERLWSETEVLYTGGVLPNPAQVPRLRWVQVHFAGVDAFAQASIMQAQDVEVTTASGVHAVHIAEYLLGQMLSWTYRLPQAWDLQKQAEWPGNRSAIFNPLELRGQTLGIAGYGSIGRELARLANALGMTVLATKRDVKHPAEASDSYTLPGTGDPNGEIPLRLYPNEALASMARECDWLVLLLPLTDATRGSVGDVVFKAMKKSAVLLNAGRGETVDEAALISALAAKRFAGAVLDVFAQEPLPTTSPLWNLENVVITPHISGFNARYHEKTSALFAENLRRYLERKPLLNRVNREFGY